MLGLALEVQTFPMELATVECLVNLTAHSFLRLITVLTYRKQTGYKVVFNCCSSAFIL